MTMPVMGVAMAVRLCLAVRVMGEGAFLACIAHLNLQRGMGDGEALGEFVHYIPDEAIARMARRHEQMR